MAKNAKGTKRTGTAHEELFGNCLGILELKVDKWRRVEDGCGAVLVRRLEKIHIMNWIQERHETDDPPRQASAAAVPAMADKSARRSCEEKSHVSGYFGVLRLISA
jgi:hypothetical protein